jgi:acetyl esterase/lipase
MSILPRLDPELVDVVSKRPVLDLTDIPAARENMAKLLAMINLAEPSQDVEHSDHLAPGAHGDPDVFLRAFRPIGEDGPLSCLYWIQGGGYVLTAPDMDDRFCETIVETHRCAVISVHWRRAPEHRFPAAANDVYAGLAWTISEADRLRIDPDRVVIGGHSSGGGKAAALALMVRDRGELSVAYQLLLYPMLDDRQTTPSSFRVTDHQLWNRESNEIAWPSHRPVGPAARDHAHRRARPFRRRGHHLRAAAHERRRPDRAARLSRCPPRFRPPGSACRRGTAVRV